MRYRIHPFTPPDMAPLRKQNPQLWSLLSHHGDYLMENAVCAERAGKLYGVGCLSYTASWHAPEGSLGQRKLLLTLWTLPELQDPDEVRAPLLAALCRRLEAIAGAHPGRQVVLQAYAEAEDGYLIGLLLDQGFGIDVAIPVLGRDLEEPLPRPAPPEGVVIRRYDAAQEGLAPYIRADTLASDSLPPYPDSPAETAYHVRHMPEFQIFVAEHAGDIIGAVSTWRGEPGRSVTENIFVLPAWRRRGVARAMVATALAALQEGGDALATLTVWGSNRPALSLYRSLGYTFRFMIVEMQKIPECSRKPALSARSSSD